MALLGDPLSVPEDPAIGYGVAPEDAPEAPLASVAPFTPGDAEQEYDESKVVWWEPPAELQDCARLGVVHTDESCPLVILRILDSQGV